MFKEIKEENQNARFIASWSGGKDSTFMVDELLRRDDPLDEVIFCDTGFEFPDMYDYIDKCKEYWENKYDIKITLLNWKNNGSIWKEWAETEYTKGDLKGNIRGFPFPVGMSWCTRQLKLIPTEKYIKENYSGFDLYEYIGIAFDEPARIPDGWEMGLKLYPMVEWRITEDMANQILRDRGMFNKLYNHFSRTGCWLCPKQSEKSLLSLKENYPELYGQIKPMEKKYFELGSKKGYKNIGIDVIEKKLISNPTGDLLNDQEPVGCFCK